MFRHVGIGCGPCSFLAAPCLGVETFACIKKEGRQAGDCSNTSLRFVRCKATIPYAKHSQTCIKAGIVRTLDQRRGLRASRRHTCDWETLGFVTVLCNPRVQCWLPDSSASLHRVMQARSMTADTGTCHRGQCCS
jgi:hypothetical protein